jgi:hypothetical protein
MATPNRRRALRGARREEPMNLYNFSYVPHGWSLAQVGQNRSDDLDDAELGPALCRDNFVRLFDRPTGWGPAGRRAAERK